MTEQRTSIAPKTPSSKSPVERLLSLPPIANRISLRSLRPNVASIKPPVVRIAGEPEPRAAARSRRPLAIAAVAIAVVAGAAVFALRAHAPPRAPSYVYVSGKAEPRTTPSGKTERWSTAHTLPIVLDASLDRADPSAKEAVLAAFATWHDANLGTPNVSVSSDAKSGVAAEDGVNRVIYAPITIKGHEQSVAVTVSYADASTGVIREADIILNSAYSFVVAPPPKSSDGEDDSNAGCGQTYDVQNTLTHEIGHFFGLGEDMEDTHATMYIRSSPCETHKRALTASDANEMKSLYAGAPAVAAATPNSAASCGKHRAQIAPANARAEWLVALGAAIVGVIARRRRRG